MDIYLRRYGWPTADTNKNATHAYFIEGESGSKANEAESIFSRKNFIKTTTKKKIKQETDFANAIKWCTDIHTQTHISVSNRKHNHKMRNKWSMGDKMTKSHMTEMKWSLAHTMSVDVLHEEMQILRHIGYWWWKTCRKKATICGGGLDAFAIFNNSNKYRRIKCLE